jgi:S-adenosylmethionine-diacylglycerol 3-amino-3-carboxypropyl transferase
VVNAGVSERFIGMIAAAVRTFVHSPSRIERLLACTTLDEQRALYDREWNSTRWRLLFTLLMNRAAFRGTYDAAFFRHVDNPSFAAHFHGLAEHALTRIPVADNYFLQSMLVGRYPVDVPGGTPPYVAGPLDPTGALTLVDGAMTAYLRTLPDRSIDGVALSNICEWLPAEEIDALFMEIARVARPGARVCFRNFVGWTEVPHRWRDTIVEDRPAGERLIARDRSVVQRRFAYCRVAA